MIKIHKDILVFLEIENLFITGTKNYFCTLLEFNAFQWIVVIDSDFSDKEAILNIKIRGEYFEIPVTINKKDDFLYSLILSENKCRKKKFLELLKKIQELEKNQKKWEKRKEERYIVADKNADKLLLSSSTQIVIYKNLQIPCLINNISFSGTNITTIMTENTGYEKGNEVGILLKFIKPIEQIVLKAYIQAVSIKTAQESSRYKFAVLSLQFIEPSFSYKNRLNTYIASIKGET